MNVTAIFSWLVLALLGATMFLLPHFAPRRFFFTITVAPGFQESAAGRSILRRYHKWCAVILVLSALAVFALPVAGMAAALAPALGGGVAFLYARAKVARFSVAPGTVREAELSSEGEHLPGWILLTLPPFLFPLATAAWLHADARAVYGMLLFCAATLLLILLPSLAMFYGSRRAEQRNATLKIFVAAMYLIAIVFVGAALTPVLRLPLWLYIAPGFLFAAGATIWSYRFVTAPGRDAEATPDACWHLGQIYYNPQDPALFVQNRLGLGYTINFGNRLSWSLLGLTLVAAGGMTLLLPRSG